MRPLHLTIEGLASLRKRQEIPFSRLDDLFAIVGPTGAGKTTILDALSLALFGEFPRAGSKEIKEFISLGAAQMQLSLHFRARGQEFLVARTFSRKASQQATLERLDPGEDGQEKRKVPLVGDGGIAQVNEEIERILGIDYKIFSRILLLPQGEFAEFLRGDAKERGRIITRLLDCEKYVRAGELARRKESVLVQEIELKAGLLAGEYADATLEHLALLEARQQENNLQEERLASVYGHACTHEHTLRDLAETLNKALSYRRALESLRTEGADIALAWNLLEARQAGLEQALTRSRLALQEANEAYEAVRSQVQAKLDEVGDEAHLARLEHAAEQLSRLDRDRAESERQRMEGAEEQQRREQRLGEATRRLAEAEAAESQAFVALKEAERERALAERVHEQAVERSHLSDTLREAQAQEAVFLQALGEAEEEVRAAESRVGSARNRQEALLREHHVSALTRDLPPGAPCPVCARVLEEVPRSARQGHEAMEEAESEVQKEEEARARAALRLTEAQVRVGSARALREEGERRLASSAAGPGEEEARVSLQNAQSRVSAAEATCREREASRREAAQAESAARAEVRGGSERLEQLALHFGQMEAQAESAMQVLRQAFPSALPPSVMAYVQEHGAALKALRSLAEARESECRLRTQEMTQAQSAHAAFESERNKLGLRLEKQSSRTEAAAEKLQEILEEDLQALLLSHVSEGPLPERLEQLTQVVQEFAARLDVRIPHLEQTRDITRDRALEEVRALGGIFSTASDLSATLPLLERALLEARKQQALLGEQADATRRKIAQREAYEAELAEKQSLADRYRRIGLELQSNRFIKYVLEENFQEMAERATEDLYTISGGRYSLTAVGNDFKVVDHWNADECRSASTFSGGESFLASLSLAMAMARGLRDLAGDMVGARLESVFIDEGFGSLDPESLEMVADALERLQESGRMVGIITHVPTLSERLSSGLEVIPAPSGSTVRLRAEAALP